MIIDSCVAKLRNVGMAQECDFIEDHYVKGISKRAIGRTATAIFGGRVNYTNLSSRTKAGFCLRARKNRRTFLITFY
ncbi:antiterminator Q family protein [Xenorhabdus littoralis]|uniref:antiterminator Q family protein n=1 Tax=Xenorhabdus littoralis TaxID=2582835 RepID=UPI0029E80E15|nr:antiterminator Q family protein [Xenorhabdus sp. psl]